jgi:hypothetical protein
MISEALFPCKIAKQVLWPGKMPWAETCRYPQKEMFIRSAAYSANIHLPPAKLSFVAKKSVVNKRGDHSPHEAVCWFPYFMMLTVSLLFSRSTICNSSRLYTSNSCFLSSPSHHLTPDFLL